jgi:hypothetical protein
VRLTAKARRALRTDEIAAASSTPRRRLRRRTDPSTSLSARSNDAVRNPADDVEAKAERRVVIAPARPVIP